MRYETQRRLKMSFTTLTIAQNKFLERHLRGTSRRLSAKQAAATYGIKNLSARMSELRKAGLLVRTSINTAGHTAYMVSKRDVYGERYNIFV